jgi:integrase
MKRRLTELSISRIKPPPRGYIWIPDRLLPSAGIRVYATGRRSWGITRREPGGKHPVFRKIGEWPTMSLSNYRTAARKRLAGEALAPVKFKQAVEEFLAHGQSKKGRPLRQNTIDQYRRNLNGYAARLINRQFSEITRREIAKPTRDIATSSGAPTAALVRSMLARLWSWGIEVGYVDNNMVTGTPAFAVPKRKRVLSDSEIRMLWQATEEREDHNLICRLCLWLGTRRGEAGGMRWSELVDGRLELPSRRTKNGQPLVLPLPRQVRAALEDWPRFVGRDHLFGRTSARGFNSWSRSKSRLDRRLQFNQDFDPHDLRRTCETRLAKLGVNKEVRSRILNHDVGDIDESYQHHDFMDEKAAALQTWADEIDRIGGVAASYCKGANY